MKVLVVGNSVSLYVRPRTAGARSYPQLLESAAREGIEVEVWASNSVMATDLVGSFEDRLLSAAPDAVVFNLGIVDCTPRICPQSWRRRFVRGVTRAQRLWLAAEAHVRRPLVRLLGGATATSVSDFEGALTRLARVARGEASARVMCLGLPATSPAVEREVPGIQAHIRAFDEAVRRACRASGAAYLDVGAIVDALGREKALPDGIHFSAQGHIAMSEALAGALTDSAPAEPAMPIPEGPAEGPVVSARAPGAALRTVALAPAVLLALFALAWVPLTRAWRALRHGPS